MFIYEEKFVLVFFFYVHVFNYITHLIFTGMSVNMDFREIW